MTRVMRKCVLCHMRPAQLQTSPSIRTVWSGATLSATNTLREFIAKKMAPDQTARIRRLVLGFAGRILHKPNFRMTRLIYPRITILILLMHNMDIKHYHVHHAMRISASQVVRFDTGHIFMIKYVAIHGISCTHITHALGFPLIKLIRVCRIDKLLIGLNSMHIICKLQIVK
jgi:hypothetical protein